MAKTKRQWILVALLLGGALLMTLALLVPGGADWVGRHTSVALAGAGGVSRSGTSASDEEAAVEEKEASATPEPEPEPQEVVPYGNHDLPHAEAIRGKVVDKEGKPVADAIVVAAYKDWRARPYAIVQAGKVRSEEDGFFVVGPLERQYYHLLAIKEGVGVGYVQSQQPGATVEIMLAEGATVRGKVTARDSGEPVAGATVIVKDWSYEQKTTTDEEGKYVLAPIPASANTWSGNEVVVVADGFLRAERTQLLLRQKDEHEVDFQLVVGETLKGKVLDAQTLQPIAGAIVGEGWEPYHRTTTSAEDGSYELAHVDTEPNQMFTVRAENYLPQQRQSDGTGEIEFQLAASLTLEGIVKDRQQNPVAGARVYLHRIKYETGYQQVRNQYANNFTTTDSEGKFEFPTVLPGQVAVIAFHMEHAPGESKPITVPLGGPVPKDTVVEMREGVTVEGEVRDLQDRPLPSIRVQLQRGWGQITGYKFVNNYIWSENPTWYTDETGKFVLKGAVAGKLYLSAWHETYGWTGTVIEGAEGQRLTDIIISFAGATIEGTFLAHDGTPVPGATVYATGPKNTPSPMWRYTQTDALGRFKLGGLKEGSYDIQGWSTYGNPEPVRDVPAGTTGVEVKLKPNQVLAGEVTSVLTGRAVESFTINIRPQQTPGVRRSSQGTYWQGQLKAPDGRFERSVNPGIYTIIVSAPGHAPRITTDVVVEENIAPQKVYITLDAGGGIKGVLRDAEGKPIANMYIRANIYRAPGEQRQQSDGMLGGNDMADAKGRYFIRGLAPGTYLIQINMGSRGAATAQVTVNGTEMVTQDLHLLPTGRVVFRVADEEGQPLQGVMFYLRDPANNNWLGWAPPSNQQGVSMSQPLRMGDATVQVYDQKQKYVADNFTITIPSGEQITVNVTMRKKDEEKKPDGG